MLNPYDIVDSGEESYRFITDSGVEYIAYFTNSPGYFEKYPDFNHDIISFTFEPSGERREALYCNGGRISKVLSQSHDRRIMDTVLFLLIDCFTKTPQKSIIVICEAEDQLDLCRHRLFNIWYQKVNLIYGDIASKYDNDFGGEGLGSIFIRNENPLHSQIREAFDNIIYENPPK